MVVVGVLAIAGLVLALAAGARVRPTLDLVERSVGNPPREIQPGASFRIVDVVVNRGRAKSRASVTRYFIRSGATSVLLGFRRVPALKPHGSSRGTVRLVVPASAQAAGYVLVACADAGQAVAEQNERNNCRTARVHMAVLAAGGNPSPSPQPPPTTTTTTADTDGDGTPDAQDCAPKDKSIHPGAPDQPDLGFVDSNCDGVDGTVTDAIFVSPSGKDTNPGTKDKPKRQIQAAVPAALNGGKRYVLAAAGAYNRVEVETGIGIYGGYDPSNWSRRSSGLVTKITGSPEGVLADGKKAVVLQLLRVRGTNPGTSGASAYGIRVVNGSSVTLQKVTVAADAGVAGVPGADGAVGADGSAGGDGAPGQCDDTNGAGGGKGGASPAHRGGDGGNGGNHDETGNNGADGMPSGDGTPSGAGGATDSTGHPGATGKDGPDGRPGANGVGGTSATLTAVWSGADGTGGLPGLPGSGGGGGGGGGGQAGIFVNDGNGNGGGGGGGGGGSGTAGRGGTAGGGSFGIYLFNSTLTVDSSSITAGNGGAGGNGGDGGDGGVGGQRGHGGSACTSEVGAGGDGGSGGYGGRGGGGGGGQGGPSVGIYKAGSSAATVKGSTVKAGTGGGGGQGGHGGLDTGGAGQDGVAKGIYP